MKVLILGGTRFIGKAIADRCLAEGHDVVLFNRGKSAPDAPYPAILGDIEELREKTDELRALRPDAVVHAIAYTEKHAEDLASVFAGTEARLTVLGSMDCYEAFRRLNAGEETSDFPLDEDAELSQVRYYWKGTGHPLADSYDKNLVTDSILRAHRNGDVRAVVYRLPMVYGPGDPKVRVRHGEILKRIVEKRVVYELDARTQARLWTYGYVENVAAAVAHGLFRDDVSGKIYNIGETSVRSWRRWAELYAEAAGFRFEFKVVPDKEEDDSPAGHFIADCSRFRRETGFQNPVGLKEGLRRTYAWAAADPVVLGLTKQEDSCRT